jgi:hypothetical protein
MSCGSLYPRDYVENWGRRYGIGLGSRPVCEAMNSRYDLPVAIDPRYPSSASHPIGVCAGMLISTEVDEKEPLNIVAVDDPYMTKRAEIMQEIQVNKSVELRTHLLRVKESKEAVSEPITGILTKI